METKKLSCNLLLIGQTGAGKSSFANYLFGTNKFTTGEGQPITTWEENLQQSSFNVKDITINVVDTVGIEANNVSRVLDEVDSFINERNKQAKDAFKMIHMIFHLLNVDSKRIQAVEIERAQDLSRRYNIPYAVILSNADKVDDTILNNMINEVHHINQNCTCIPVCSTATVTRAAKLSGSAGKQFGKEKAVSFFLQSAYETVGRYAAIDALNNIVQITYQIETDIKEQIKKLSLIKTVKNDGDIDNFLDDDILSKYEKDSFISPSLKNFEEFLDSFDTDYAGKNLFDETMELFAELELDELVNNHPTMQKIEKLSESDEINAGIVFATIGLAFTYKGKMKRLMKDVFEEIRYKCTNQIYKLKN